MAEAQAGIDPAVAAAQNNLDDAKAERVDAKKRLVAAEAVLAGNKKPTEKAKLEKNVLFARGVYSTAMATEKEAMEALKETQRAAAEAQRAAAEAQRAAAEAQCLVTAQGLQQLRIAHNGACVEFVLMVADFVLCARWTQSRPPRCPRRVRIWVYFDLLLTALCLAGQGFSSSSVADNYRSNARKLNVAAAATFLPLSVPVANVPRPPATLVDEVAEVVVQTYMETVATALPKHPQCLDGTAPVVSFGTRKPDLTAYIAGADGTPVSRDVTHVTLVGELKRPRAAAKAGVFTDDEKGQTLSLAEDLVKVQVWRASSGGGLATVVAFLLDGRHIIFFKCVYEVIINSHVHVELEQFFESPPMPLFDGGLQQLAGLLCAAPSAVGHSLPVFTVDGQVVAISRFLGLGATSAGFCGVLNEAAVVVKQYRPDFESDLEREVLLKLQQQDVPGVVRLVAVSDAVNHKGVPDLVLEPVGATSYSSHAEPSFAPSPAVGLWHSALPVPAVAVAHTVCQPKAQDYCDLVDALVNVHTAGFVHRDPRPSNFFRTASGHFFLADFGSAVHIGAVAPSHLPHGCHYGPMAVLEAMAARHDLPASIPEHDFEQVARLVFVTASQRFPVKPTEIAAVLAWWTSTGQSPILQRLLGGARGNVAQFKECIQRELA
jgi:hypothetical protein